MAELPHTPKMILSVLRASIEKYVISYQPKDVNDAQVKILCHDIFEVFRYDSLEDLLWILKRARQGYYGNTYGKINMNLIREWRLQHRKSKPKWVEYYGEVNYKAYKKRMKFSGSISESIEYMQSKKP